MRYFLSRISSRSEWFGGPVGRRLARQCQNGDHRACDARNGRARPIVSPSNNTAIGTLTSGYSPASGVMTDAFPPAYAFTTA